VKNAIIQVDATPFKQWYQQHYGVEPGQKKRGGAAPEAEVILSAGFCRLRTPFSPDSQLLPP